MTDLRHYGSNGHTNHEIVIKRKSYRLGEPSTITIPVGSLECARVEDGVAIKIYAAPVNRQPGVYVAIEGSETRRRIAPSESQKARARRHKQARKLRHALTGAHCPYPTKDGRCVCAFSGLVWYRRDYGIAETIGYHAGRLFALREAQYDADHRACIPVSIPLILSMPEAHRLAALAAKSGGRKLPPGFWRGARREYAWIMKQHVMIQYVRPR